MSSNRCTCSPSFSDPYPDLCRHCEEGEPEPCETCGTEHREDDECSFTCDVCNKDDVQGEPNRTDVDTTLRVCDACASKCCECGIVIAPGDFKRDGYCAGCSAEWNAASAAPADLVETAA